MLRGVALFGILLVNVFSFGADYPAWSGVADQLAWQVKHVLFETKFWTLYSLLFGMGFFLQTQSAGYGAARSLRRLGVLMLLGCLHGLLFEGDILMLYAELGSAALAGVSLADKMVALTRIATGSSAFPCGHLLGGDRGDDWPAENLWKRRACGLRRSGWILHWPSGSFTEVLAFHATFLPERFWADWQYPDSGFLVLACFLLGFCIMRGMGRAWRLTARQAASTALGFGWWGCLLMGIEGYWSAHGGLRPFERSDATRCRYSAAIWCIWRYPQFDGSLVLQRVVLGSESVADRS